MAWVTWKQCILLCTVNKHNNIFKDPLYVCWPWLPQTHILVHTTCMYVICRGPDVGKAWVNRPGLCWLCIQPDSVHTMKGGGGYRAICNYYWVGWVDLEREKCFQLSQAKTVNIWALLRKIFWENKCVAQSFNFHILDLYRIMNNDDIFYLYFARKEDGWQD